jgi:hypothetical protein
MCRILICICALAISLYAYIDKQNALTRLRLQIPLLAKELKDLTEENTRLQYEIDLFESPQHLMQLASHSEFSHLKHPLTKQIITLSEGLALQAPVEDSREFVKSRPVLVLGAKRLLSN